MVYKYTKIEDKWNVQIFIDGKLVVTAFGRTKKEARYWADKIKSSHN